MIKERLNPKSRGWNELQDTLKTVQSIHSHPYSQIAMQALHTSCRHLIMASRQPSTATFILNLREIIVKRKVWQFLAAVFIGLAFTACSDPDSESGNGKEISQSKSLVRDYSPVIGPDKAQVTIVEFFDPACEACRAYYPYVKQIMAAFPGDVRLVLRYVLFHRGSEEAVTILEAARLQNLFVPFVAHL